MERATVYRWNIRNGTGVLTRTDGSLAWFHLSTVEKGDVFTLSEGDPVDAEIENVPQGVRMSSGIRAEARGVAVGASSLLCCAATILTGAPPAGIGIALVPWMKVINVPRRGQRRITNNTDARPI
ncbi:hypothetical protein [Nocardia farcinica]|uniref:hypothetical protein n=1 Tax=Nocardia farcinica TaxID=37329 RepID=UPI002458992A|nr:hypothetical protein [Nocardia farcinica]